MIGRLRLVAWPLLRRHLEGWERIEFHLWLSPHIFLVFHPDFITSASRFRRITPSYNYKVLRVKNHNIALETLKPVIPGQPKFSNRVCLHSHHTYGKIDVRVGFCVLWLSTFELETFPLIVATELSPRRENSKRNSCPSLEQCHHIGCRFGDWRGKLK